MKKKSSFLSLLLAVIVLFVLAALSERKIEPNNEQNNDKHSSIETVSETADVSDIPAYSGNPYVVINDNKPFFTQDEIVTEAFENYSDLDTLSRAGAATACLSKELMPTEEREYIGYIRPTGWHNVTYPGLIEEDEHLYNRSHLIAFALAGENANEKNLITGTRYFNQESMLAFETDVMDYVKKTDNHVMYRVTPVFEGNDLVARGVLMEAYSVEDDGRGVEFCVFVYNIQPGIEIDYATGDSRKLE